jgi:hypothetical protein
LLHLINLLDRLWITACRAPPEQIAAPPLSPRCASEPPKSIASLDLEASTMLMESGVTPLINGLMAFDCNRILAKLNERGHRKTPDEFNRLSLSLQAKI